MECTNGKVIKYTHAFIKLVCRKGNEEISQTQYNKYSYKTEVLN